MEDTNMNKGIEVFNEFVNKIPEGISNFDYFVLLDYLSQKRIDKETIISTFRESILFFINLGNKNVENKLNKFEN